MRSLISLILAILFTIEAMPATAGSSAESGAEPPRFETAQGFFREYALGPVSSGPAIVAVGEDDAVWIALARSGQLARFSNESLQLFEIGSDSRPVGLALGNARNGHPGVVWIAASYDNKILRFDVATHQTKAYPIPGEESWPFNIALGPDGAVWFTQRAAGKLGRLDPGSGEVRHFEPPTPNCGPAGLAVDPESGVVWFTESYADRIGRFDPKTSRFEEIAMGGASSGQVSGPAGLALDARGGVWFAKLEGKIGHIPPGSNRIELIDTPPEALRTAGVAVAPDQDIWALALDGNLLLRYRPQTRTFTQYPVPTGQPDLKPSTPPFAKTSRPFGIGIDREGNVWFSEQYMGQLGVLDVSPPRVEVVSPAGKVQTLRIPLTTRVGDRVAGVRRTEVRLDGEPVTAVQGHLDLSGRPPGSHRLEVRVEDWAGHAASVETAFDYAPGHLALLEAIGRLQPLDAEGAAAREKWLASVAELPKREPGEVLPALRADLTVHLPHFRPGPEAGLEPILDFLERQGGRRVEVTILDQSPYFEPRAVTVRRGDTVLWRYDPPSDGHSLSRKLHRIEIQTGDTAVRSGLLRAGESFVHRFEAAGTYTIKDSELIDAQAVIEVQAP